jgi:hypothetical protein
MLLAAIVLWLAATACVLAVVYGWIKNKKQHVPNAA